MFANRAHHWGTGDVPDLVGKVAVVTGANSGIGYETARELARNGAETVLACRSSERGGRAIDALQAELPARAWLMELNLASLASIERFCVTFAERFPRLDVLVNNAGIMGAPFGYTEDGFELQVGTNHLGHFALTGRLFNRILSTPGARVVTVSSNTHWVGRINRSRLLHREDEYSRWKGYSRSKLCNLLFAYELQRRLQQARVDAIALASHPGYTATNIGSAYSKPRPRWMSWIRDLFIQDPEAGALPTLRAATDPNASGGQYIGPRGLFQMRGHPVPVRSSRSSRNEGLAKRVWEMSEDLTGVRYPRPEEIRNH